MTSGMRTRVGGTCTRCPVIATLTDQSFPETGINLPAEPEAAHSPTCPHFAPAARRRQMPNVFAKGRQDFVSGHDFRACRKQLQKGRVESLRENSALRPEGTA